MVVARPPPPSLADGGAERVLDGSLDSGTRIAVDVRAPRGRILRLVMNESAITSYTDDRGAGLPAARSPFNAVVSAGGSRMIVWLNAEHAPSRDAQRVTVRAKLVLETADTVSTVSATLGAGADKRVPTKLGELHVTRTDGIGQPSAFEPTPSPATTITLVDVEGLTPFLGDPEFRIDGVVARPDSTGTRMSNGHYDKTYMLAHTKKPVTVSIQVTEPRRETIDLEVVSGLALE